MYQTGDDRQLPWLPNERFELALDSRLGAASSATAGDNVLTITSRRAIKLGSEIGKRTTSMVPLDRITGVEVIDIGRPAGRLGWGLIILAVGLVLGLFAYYMTQEWLVTLLMGGLPVLAAIYILTGYLFPDSQSELVLHTGSYALRHTLLTPTATRDAYLAAHRIYDLMVEAAEATNGLRPRTPSNYIIQEPETSQPTPAPRPSETNVHVERPPQEAPSWSSERATGEAEREPRWSSVWAPQAEPDGPAASPAQSHEPPSPAARAWEPPSGPERPLEDAAPTAPRYAHDEAAVAEDERHRDELSPAAERFLENGTEEPTDDAPPARP